MSVSPFPTPGGLPIAMRTAPDGRIAAACPACGTGGLWQPDSQDIRCDTCGARTSYRHCKRCKGVVIFPPKVTESPKWKHVPCGKTAFADRWPAATVREDIVSSDLVTLWSRLGLVPFEVLSDQKRRHISGSVVEAQGLTGVVSGGATIFFERGVVALCIGTISNVTLLPYEAITGLSFGGRGAVVTRSGGGIIGGGFGLKGAVEGMAMASVANAMLTKTTTSREAIVQLTWQEGHVVLRNTQYLPATLARPLDQVLERLRDSARAADTHDLVAKLAQLGELHATGVLSDEEFVAAKARLLNSSN
jgi:Short C-terminal domain